MANDISIGHEPTDLVPARESTSFAEFHESEASRLGVALWLVLRDHELVAAALDHALGRTAHRWDRQMANHPNAAGWCFGTALDRAEEQLEHRASPLVDTATGGYRRGLSLEQSIAALPAGQRAALVGHHFLGWTDDRLAAGLGVRTGAAATRRTRAEAFIGHHLGASEAEVRNLVRRRFREQAELAPRFEPEPSRAQQLGRRRALRNRIGGAALLLAIIAIGGAVFDLGQRIETGDEQLRDTIEPPTASRDWFGPLSDGAGGFIALNTAGAARFASSPEGELWYRAAIWNSRAVDLRSEVSGFDRSGGRYLTTIESAPSIRAFVPPRVAVSDDLVDWQVLEIDVGELPETPGLRPQVSLLSVAATDSRILAAVGIDEVVDHRALGIRPDDVCVEAHEGDSLVLHMCEGGTVDVLSAGATAPRQRPISFYLSEPGRPFVEVVLPVDADPYGLFSLGDRFGVLDVTAGELLTSVDGRQWTTAVRLDEPNRFTLAAGSPDARAVVISPDRDGWSSHVLDGDTVTSGGSLPTDLAPATVWIKPELAAGPAGWALFITTSRPWERTETTVGWAVETDAWIVSRLPDSDTITAQAVDGTTTYRFEQRGTWVVPESPGAASGDPGVRLLRPDTNETLVTVTSEQIDRSREFDGEDRVRARVLFSEDGLAWRAIWQSTQDTWLGTVAVGDDEVLLSGSQLTGGPIRIPLEAVDDG